MSVERKGQSSICMHISDSALS